MRIDGKKRIVVVLLIAAVCFAMLFSLCFIAAAAHHDCTGEDCAVCMQISFCESVLRTLSQSAAAIFAAGAVVCLIVSVSFAAKKGLSVDSPVSLRVKLSD